MKNNLVKKNGVSNNFGFGNPLYRSGNSQEAMTSVQVSENQVEGPAEESSSNEVRSLKNLMMQGFDIAASRLWISEHVRDANDQFLAQSVTNLMQQVYEALAFQQERLSAVEYNQAQEKERLKNELAFANLDIARIHNEQLTIKGSLEGLSRTIDTKIDALKAEVEKMLQNNCNELVKYVRVEDESLMKQVDEKLSSLRKDVDTEVNKLDAQEKTLYNMVNRQVNELSDAIEKASGEINSFKKNPPVKSPGILNLNNNNLIGATKNDKPDNNTGTTVKSEIRTEKAGSSDSPGTSKPSKPDSVGTSNLPKEEALSTSLNAPKLVNNAIRATGSPQGTKQTGINASKKVRFMSDENEEDEDYNADVYVIKKHEIGFIFEKVKQSTFESKSFNPKWTFVKEEFKRTTAFYVQDRRDESKSLADKLKKRAKQWAKNFDATKVKNLDKISDIYELTYTDDAVTLVGRSNTEVERNKLSTFFVEKGANRFVLVDNKKLLELKKEKEKKKKEEEQNRKKKEAEKRKKQNSFRPSQNHNQNSNRWPQRNRPYYDDDDDYSEPRYRKKRPNQDALVNRIVKAIDNKLKSLPKNY